MAKWRGNLTNRLAEGHNYLNRELREGDDITMYFYSDRHCYYITEVISQTEIKVKKYEICADHDKPGGMGHQNWLYFKTKKEINQYLNKYFPDHCKDENPTEPEPETWAFNCNRWRRQETWDLTRWNELLERAKKDVVDPTNETKVVTLAKFYAHLTEKQIERIIAGKTVKKYFDLQGKISFGVKDYYYDWEF